MARDEFAGGKRGGVIVCPFRLATWDVRQIPHDAIGRDDPGSL